MQVENVLSSQFSVSTTFVAYCTFCSSSPILRILIWSIVSIIYANLIAVHFKGDFHTWNFKLELSEKKTRITVNCQ